MNKVLFSSNCQEWRTPKLLFNRLNSIYNFEVDLCADEKNHLCKYYFTKERTCFNADLHNTSIFCNPPYSRGVGKYVKLCYDLAFKHNNIVVMLLPARTDTKWFHDFIWPDITNCKILFIKGRLKFNDGIYSAPFPSMIVVYNGGKLNEHLFSILY